VLSSMLAIEQFLENLAEFYSARALKSRQVSKQHERRVRQERQENKIEATLISRIRNHGTCEAYLYG